MRTKYQLLWGSLFFSFLLPSCIADSLSGSSDEGVMLQPSFSLAPVQAEVRNAQNFSPEEGSQFTVERTDDNGTSKAIYTIKDSKMLSDAPLLLPKAGTYSFRIYGRSGDATNGIPVAFYDDAEVSKEGNASFSLHIVCAAMQVQLQNTDGTPIAKGNAKISLPELHGCGVFKTDFTVADETAIEVDNNSTPSGHNDEDILFHPEKTLTGGEELITISYEGKTYRYSPSSIPNFSAGKRYIYTLRLGTELAELVTVDIADFKPFILTKDNNNGFAGIYTEEDLIAFREAINKNSSIAEWSVTDKDGNNIINLYNDIKLTQEWVPINSFSNLQFNGNGHTISGLQFGLSTGKTGFFIEVKNATIKNLNITDVSIKLEENSSSIINKIYCGTLVSIAASSTIKNVHIKKVNITAAATKTSTTLYIGVLSGAYVGNITIDNVSVENAVIAGTSQYQLYIAGLSGYSTGVSITHTTLADIQITGIAKSTIYIAGLNGYSKQTSTIDATLTDVQVKGTCSGSSMVYTGGICGMNDETSPMQKISLNDISIDANATFYTYSGGIVGYNRKTDSPISQSKLDNIIMTSSTSKLVYNFTGGIVGYNLSPLENIELYNITCSAEAPSIYSTTDDKYKPYLCIGGAIGYNTASLHNIHASNLQIIASSPVEKDIPFLGAGGIVGFCYNSISPTMTQSSVDQCTVKGYKAGGIIGYNYSASLIGCAATNVNIDSNICSGGLIGYNYQGKNVFGCYSTGTVAISSEHIDGEYFYAGGLTGKGGNTVEVSYSTCDVINPSEDNDNYYSESYAGSFLGGGGRIYCTSCYATGSVNNSQNRDFIGNADLYENSEIRFCYTTQTDFVTELRAPAQLGGSANWDKLSPLPEEILRSKASITVYGTTWKASSLWLVPSKGAHPVINMNYHGE